MTRRRAVLFLFSSMVILGAVYVLYSALDTLRQLDAIEADRDRWQNPGAVLHALDLHPGDTVVDLGSGSGYFALKIAPIIGPQGRVFAVDLRRLSLSFLWMRAERRGLKNIRVTVGEQNDPRLPAGAVDAVLIANTYHEFHDPLTMLEHVSSALRPGGRVVIADRAPQDLARGHEIPLADVVSQLQETGFQIVEREDNFIHPTGDDAWWMLVARTPRP